MERKVSSMQVPGNPSQQIAIKHHLGPMLVLAGPGSGKTFVITQRIRYLVECYHENPALILVVTFTKASALEMQSRFKSLCENASASVSFGTFHAIFYSILRDAKQYKNSKILKTYEKKRILSDLVKQKGYHLLLTKDNLEGVLSEFSMVKNREMKPQKYTSDYLSSSEFPQVFADYQEKCREEGKVDFDDMVLLCEAVLLKDSSLLQKWQRLFRFILIDEFQDISPAQYRVVQMLAKPENNLFIVGDDDQSIYGFRGASPQIMLGFEQDYENVKRVLLDVNYRSAETIVQKAQKLIVCNSLRFEKKVCANQKGGLPVEIVKLTTKEEEYTALCQKLLLEKEENNLENCAIITRTRSLFGEIGGILSLHHIPYQCSEKVPGLFDDMMVLDFLAYLKLARGDTSRELLLQIINKPVRYVKRDSIPKNGEIDLLLFYNKENRLAYQNLLAFKRDLQMLAKMPLHLGIIYIRKKIGYDAYLQKEAGFLAEKQRERLERADYIVMCAKKCKNLNEFTEFINCETEKAGYSCTGEKRGVHLITMHGSKGLEYDKVILPDCNEGQIPHKKAKAMEEIEEERRMFYVAMTRAKKELSIYYLTGNKDKPYFPSRFLNPLFD